MKAVLRGLRDYNVNSYTVTLKSNEKKYCVVTISAKDYYTLQSESELMLIVDGMEIFTGIINKINFDYQNNKYTITLDELAYKLAIDYDLISKIQAGRLPGWANEPILLTIPAGSVTGVLEDFPIMVKLSGASGKTAADVSKVFTALGSDANRKRICVTAGDGITPCYVEIKEWSTATHTAYLWVRVPRIDPGLDTHLYLYYDPLHAEMTNYVGDTASETAWNVWDNKYEFVGMKPSGGLLLDSTRNQNHGTIYGATVTQGPLGACLSFDGVDDSVVVSTPPPITADTPGVTMTSMMSLTSYQSDWRYLFHRGPTLNVGDSIIWAGKTDIHRFNVTMGANVGSHADGATTYVPDLGQWYHLAGTWDTVTGRVYVGGEEIHEYPKKVTLASEDPIHIGGKGAHRCLSAQIAYVEYSHVARSPAWIAATNLSLRDELIVYSDGNTSIILSEILANTAFTVGYVPIQTIPELKGDKLNRYEWLRLLADNCVCGLDVNGKYTTIAENIVSEQTACDVWTVGNEIFIGVNGCTRSNKSSHTWNKKTCDISNAIIDIPEIEVNVHPVQKVIVIGKDGVTGEASVGTSPTIVITDDSCADAAACEKRAKVELNKQNKLASLTINVDPDLFYSKAIELGCHVTISEPAFIAGTYEIIEMEITQEKCSITLDRPKKRLETILDDLKRRVNLIERWR